MTDVPHVTDGPKGPTMDDLADLHARTNRAIIALSQQVSQLWAMVAIGVFLILASLTRLAGLLRAVPGVS